MEKDLDICNLVATIHSGNLLHPMMDGVCYTPPQILKDSSRTPQTPQNSLKLLQNSSNSPQGLPGLLKDSSRTPSP
jgi:hypothetical protein